MKRGRLFTFFGLTFLISWGLGVLLVLAGEEAAAWFELPGGTNLVFTIAVWAPAIAAITLTLYDEGLSGLRTFLARLGIWRVPIFWYLVILIGLPTTQFIGFAFRPDADWSAYLASLPDPGTALLLILAALVVGPVEEIGWRGYALPLMQRVMSPLAAAIVLGAVWAVWHLPAFFIQSAVQSQWSFAAFFLGLLALSLIITAMFNAAHGSILLPVLFHWQTNNPLLPDAQPYDILPTLIFALLIAVWKRRYLSQAAKQTALYLTKYRSPKML